ncbi:hemerythrin domain-containing protein [Nitratireductor sp.]|uniref:hemerythrin domain-containing protein n=1 Tax=Nitratireductor sp. TaxID=1872084 RepID=UPI0025E63E73|nr:hemerythrin domain-containing protein [Nitratireductor sp.]
MTEVPEPLKLETRVGLPADLRCLVEKYPREDWQTHPNLGEMARFWLQRHDMFRELGGMLKAGVADYREDKFASHDFARWFAPRLRFFLQQLQGHHHIEDTHYFPVFAKAEPRMKRGFDLLDSDHHVIHDALERNAQAGTSLLQALQANNGRERFSADAYASENEVLLAMLLRHLGDEEDLIIPLILDRSEEGLGVGI